MWIYLNPFWFGFALGALAMLVLIMVVGMWIVRKPKKDV